MYPITALVAGQGRRGFVDGRLTDQSYFDSPQEFCVLPDGRVLVADGGNNCLRLVDIADAGGKVVTVPTHGFLSCRSPVLIDGGAAVAVADVGHSKIRMIQIHQSGTGALDVEDCTIAGSGKAAMIDGPAETAAFHHPQGLLVIGDGSILVADTGNNAIRRIAARAGKPGLYVSTIAGSSTAGFCDGEAGHARFSGPTALTVDEDGTVIVSDTGNHALRALHQPQGAGGAWSVTTIAGGVSGYADGRCGVEAAFREPLGLAVGSQGELLVCDGAANSIRAVLPSTDDASDGVGSNNGPILVGMSPDGLVGYVDPSEVDDVAGGSAKVAAVLPGARTRDAAPNKTVVISPTLLRAASSANSDGSGRAAASTVIDTAIQVARGALGPAGAGAVLLPAPTVIVNADPVGVLRTHLRYGRVVTVAGASPAELQVLASGISSAVREHSPSRPGKPNTAAAAAAAAAAGAASTAAFTAALAQVKRYAEGPSTSVARFRRPTALCVLPPHLGLGSVLVSDSGNHLIRLLLSADAARANTLPPTLAALVTPAVLQQAREVLASGHEGGAAMGSPGGSPGRGRAGQSVYDATTIEYPDLSNTVKAAIAGTAYRNGSGNGSGSGSGSASGAAASGAGRTAGQVAAKQAAPQDTGEAEAYEMADADEDEAQGSPVSQTLASGGGFASHRGGQGMPRGTGHSTNGLPSGAGGLQTGPQEFQGVGLRDISGLSTLEVLAVVDEQMRFEQQQKEQHQHQQQAHQQGVSGQGKAGQGLAASITDAVSQAVSKSLRGAAAPSSSAAVSTAAAAASARPVGSRRSSISSIGSRASAATGSVTGRAAGGGNNRRQSLTGGSGAVRPPPLPSMAAAAQLLSGAAGPVPSSTSPQTGRPYFGDALAGANTAHGAGNEASGVAGSRATGRSTGSGSPGKVPAYMAVTDSRSRHVLEPPAHLQHQRLLRQAYATGVTATSPGKRPAAITGSGSTVTGAGVGAGFGAGRKQSLDAGLLEAQLQDLESRLYDGQAGADAAEGLGASGMDLLVSLAQMGHTGGAGGATGSDAGRAAGLARRTSMGSTVASGTQARPAGSTAVPAEGMHTPAMELLDGLNSGLHQRAARLQPRGGGLGATVAYSPKMASGKEINNQSWANSSMSRLAAGFAGAASSRGRASSSGRSRSIMETVSDPLAVGLLAAAALAAPSKAADMDVLTADPEALLNVSAALLDTAQAVHGGAGRGMSNDARSQRTRSASGKASYRAGSVERRMVQQTVLPVLPAAFAPEAALAASGLGSSATAPAVAGAIRPRTGVPGLAGLVHTSAPASRTTLDYSSRDALAAEQLDASGAVVRALLLSDAPHTEAEANRALAALQHEPSDQTKSTLAPRCLVSARFVRHTLASASRLREQGQPAPLTAPAFVNVPKLISKKVDVLKARAKQVESEMVAQQQQEDAAQAWFNGQANGSATGTGADGASATGLPSVAGGRSPKAVDVAAVITTAVSPGGSSSSSRYVTGTVGGAAAANATDAGQGGLKRAGSVGSLSRLQANGTPRSQSSGAAGLAASTAATGAGQVSTGSATGNTGGPAASTGSGIRDSGALGMSALGGHGPSSLASAPGTASAAAPPAAPAVFDASFDVVRALHPSFSRTAATTSVRTEIRASGVFQRSAGVGGRGSAPGGSTPAGSAVARLAPAGQPYYGRNTLLLPMTSIMR